jgi:hypothetical protein
MFKLCLKYSNLQTKVMLRAKIPSAIMSLVSLARTCDYTLYDYSQWTSKDRYIAGRLAEAIAVSIPQYRARVDESLRDIMLIARSILHSDALTRRCVNGKVLELTRRVDTLQGMISNFKSELFNIMPIKAWSPRMRGRRMPHFIKSFDDANGTNMLEIMRDLVHRCIADYMNRMPDKCVDITRDLVYVLPLDVFTPVGDLAGDHTYLINGFDKIDETNLSVIVHNIMYDNRDHFRDYWKRNVGMCA